MLFILQLSVISQILELIYRTITIFSFDHMTDENREYAFRLPGLQLPKLIRKALL